MRISVGKNPFGRTRSRKRKDKCQLGSEKIRNQLNRTGILQGYNSCQYTADIDYGTCIEKFLIFFSLSPALAKKKYKGLNGKLFRQYQWWRQHLQAQSLRLAQQGVSFHYNHHHLPLV
jgi:hypothetical protein